jgi:hypothetical protein
LHFFSAEQPEMTGQNPKLPSLKKHSALKAGAKVDILFLTAKYFRDYF